MEDIKRELYLYNLHNGCRILARFCVGNLYRVAGAGVHHIVGGIQRAGDQLEKIVQNVGEEGPVPGETTPSVAYMSEELESLHK